METAPFPVLVPLVTAAVLAALEHVRGKKLLLDLLSLAAALTALCLDIYLLRASLLETVVYWFGGWRPMGGFPVGIAFVVDPAAAALAVLAAFLTTMGFMFTWKRFRSIRTYYHTLMLLFLASLQGFCLTGDLFNMFVFFELMGVTAYALTGYKIEESGPLQGALNFSVMNSLGGVMVLFGIALLYARIGGLNLAWVGASIRGGGADRTLAAAFMLLAAGFLVKGAVVPFHFWLPDAHAVAPTPASILFSGIMVQLGLYAVARIYWTVFSGTAEVASLQPFLIAAASATAFLGAVMAALQRHLKRMLAYSTVSHSGVILAGLALLDRSALSGTLLYILGHGAVKGALFAATGIVIHHFSSVDEEGLRGRCGGLRWTGALFCVAALALAGLPPFGTWAGKGIIEKGAEAAGLAWISPLFILTSGITGGAVLRAGASIFFGVGSANPLSDSAPASGREEAPETNAGAKERTPAMMFLPFLLLLLTSLAVGVAPQVRVFCGEAALRFVDGTGYRDAVLKAATGTNTAATQEPLPGVAPGLGAAVTAVAVAALFLLPQRRPERGWKEKAAAPLHGILSLLRRVHSGYIGDYVTWFMIGVTLMLLVSLTF